VVQRASVPLGQHILQQNRARSPKLFVFNVVAVKRIESDARQELTSLVEVGSSAMERFFGSVHVLGVTVSCNSLPPLRQAKGSVRHAEPTSLLMSAEKSGRDVQADFEATHLVGFEL
jgi:hypothetical protein